MSFFGPASPLSPPMDIPRSEGFSPPALTEIPEIFARQLGEIRYGVSPTSYQDWHHAYDAFVNPENDYAPDPLAVVLVDRHTIEKVSEVLQSGYFNNPVIILNALMPQEILPLIRGVQQGHPIRALGFWNLSEESIRFIMSKFPLSTLQRIVVSQSDFPQDLFMVASSQRELPVIFDQPLLLALNRAVFPFLSACKKSK